MKNPDNLSSDEVSKLKQIEQTQFYSNFEIQNTKGEWLMLEDILTGKIYKVFDRLASQEMKRVKGTFFNRLAKVDDKWYLVGSNPVLFPIVYTSRMKKMLRENKLDENTPTPIILAEILLKRRNKPIKKPKKLTKEEIIKKRLFLQKSYNQKAKKYKSKFPFEKLINNIYKEDGTNVLDFWTNLGKEGLGEDFAFKEFKLMQNIWNYFPHKCLGGKCPEELFRERQSKTL